MSDQLIQLVQRLMTKELRQQDPETAFAIVYELLPIDIRLSVTKNAFVLFCLVSEASIIERYIPEKSKKHLSEEVMSVRYLRN